MVTGGSNSMILDIGSTHLISDTILINYHKSYMVPKISTTVCATKFCPTYPKITEIAFMVSISIPFNRGDF